MVRRVRRRVRVTGVRTMRGVRGDCRLLRRQPVARMLQELLQD
jgi:hypothetical protein